MRAIDLWNSMSNGLDSARISDKQRTFLIDLARKEGIFLADQTMINFPDGTLIFIRHAMRACSGYGGVVASQAVPGWNIAKKKFLIRFLDTGIREIVDNPEIERLQRDGYKFEIEKDYKNNNRLKG